MVRKGINDWRRQPEQSPLMVCLARDGSILFCMWATNCNPLVYIDYVHTESLVRFRLQNNTCNANLSNVIPAISLIIVVLKLISQSLAIVTLAFNVAM